MSTHTNHRTDEYGGSFENRIKYPMDVLKTVIDEVNGEVPVQIRVSVDEYVDDGMKFEEVKTVCHIAKEMGVASISLSAGCYDAVEYAIQPMFIPQGFIIPFAKELKAEIDIPVIVAVRLNDAHLIENVVENDEADIVAIGRGLIADSLLIDKIKAHDYDNIRYCIACNQGCIDRVLGGMPAHCMVNPVAGEELTCKLKGKSDKKVVIIGAGPAGMEAAITAAQRGMKVTVYEKGELGGKFKALSTPPEKDTFMMFDRYLVSQMKKYNIEVIDKNIDFRRVRNLDVYLKNNSISLTKDLSQIEEWQGGDIIVFKDHIGIISDKRNKKGIPFLIHHANLIQVNYEEDVLELYGQDYIIGHYRIS